MIFNCIQRLLFDFYAARKSRKNKQIQNIAGRMSENSRNSFVDLQSQKDKRNNTKKFIKR